MIIKRGKVEILDIIDAEEGSEENPLKEGSEAERQVIKNTNKDGNKIESSKDLVN
jgi:hypothetical protein